MQILKENLVVKASKDLVWQAWTISDEVMKWFVPKAAIEAVEGGRYELIYHAEQEIDMSDEICRILSIQPTYRLVFQWRIPEIANPLTEASTVVAVCLKEISDKTSITVSHSGWGEGTEWLQAMDWHKHNWNQILTSLKSYLETGKGFISFNSAPNKN
ncbi:uncharacterized protein YndB with AHSA1/START domain [Bacillus oleivorans]|uniref:Uncharacterized protein YndB with AHSA1/START domain n=1 Tax=Bacillus oleivorans TaxID=1448271 RepID=A0A285CY08_9BACI|nr:SRPBCC domain-containing protein [Bacillus oleivorans]SNX72442.1 uncharacterized protein YndB with AHSA1/START domain [Bacillus oleivorans]